ncbi:MAG TPA: NlpC/P60 family protein [Coriobacteriia bacterium]|nr:NlpC/P60 family protein [Coriobacteriia bacterium]
MVRGRFARLCGRTCALTLVVALLGAVPVYADNSTATDTAGSTATDSGTAASSPTGTSTATDGSASSTKTTKPRKAPTKSEVDVSVSEKTQQFRQDLLAKQKRLDEYNAKLAGLEKEFEIASEAYNEAKAKLDEVNLNVATATTDLANALDAFQVQTDLLGDRASAIYKDGSLGSLELLLKSESMADLIARVKFLNTIGTRDADVAASLRGQKEDLEKRVADLKNSQAVAASLEFELRARKIEVENREKEMRGLYEGAQTDLLALLDTEASRRQVEQQSLLTDVLSGASSKGVVATVGSPVETALAYHGVPYLWGGATTRGFDCSGLVLYVFAQHGVSLPHYSGSQARLGTKVTYDQLQPGDVVFFGSPIHHVGIYAGGGYYIHAPRTGDFVKISKLSDRGDFACARRYAWSYRAGEPRNAVTDTSTVLQSYGGSR